LRWRTNVDWTLEQSGELPIPVILKCRPKVMAPVLLEAMPLLTEEYCRMRPAKYKNSGTGAFTDL
jgi:hypothetical protein